MKPIYLLDALRTPVGRLYGSLATMRPDDLGAFSIKALLQRQPFSPDLLEMLILGCANQAGEDNRNLARMVVFLSGLSPNVGAITLNSLCTSGLDAVTDAARRIALGENDLVLAGGVESMSRSPWVEHRSTGQREDSTIGWRFINPHIYAHYQPNAMPQTAELLAAKLGISRQAQDEYALLSRQRYQAAWAAGSYQSELLPLPHLLDHDEQHRLLSPETLRKMPAILGASAQYISLANSARIGDGAAALLLASEDFVRRHALQPLAQLTAWGTAATHPDDMGLTPVLATQKALKMAGLGVQDLQRVEMSESFAVQTLACTQLLNLSPALVNPNGGELSMGKPLGSSGARLLVSLAWAMQQNPDIRYGLATTCAGLGLGTAVLLEGVPT